MNHADESLFMLLLHFLTITKDWIAISMDIIIRLLLVLGKIGQVLLLFVGCTLTTVLYIPMVLADAIAGWIADLF